MQSWKVLKNSEPNSVFCTKKIRSGMDNGNGWKIYITGLRTHPDPSLPSIRPLVYKQFSHLKALQIIHSMTIGSQQLTVFSSQSFIYYLK